MVEFPATATSGDANDLTNVTIDTPAGTLADDTLLFWAWRKPGAPILVPPSPAYVERVNTTLLGFEAVRLYVWSYLAGASEPSSVLFTSPDFADFNVWGCVPCRGSSGVGDVQMATNLGTVWTAPSANVVGAGAGLITLALGWDTLADGAQSPITDQGTAFTPYRVRIGSNVGLAAGPTGDRSGGCTNWEWFGVNLVLEPAAAASGDGLFVGSVSLM